MRKTAEIARRFDHPEVSGECWRVAGQTSSWSPGAAIKAVSLAQEAGVCAPQSTASYQRALRQTFFVDGLNKATDGSSELLRWRHASLRYLSTGAYAGDMFLAKAGCEQQRRSAAAPLHL